MRILIGRCALPLLTLSIVGVYWLKSQPLRKLYSTSSWKGKYCRKAVAVLIIIPNSYNSSSTHVKGKLLIHGLHTSPRWPPLNLYVSCFLGVSSSACLLTIIALHCLYQLELIVDIASIHINFIVVFFFVVCIQSIGEHKPWNKNQGRLRTQAIASVKTTIQSERVVLLLNLSFDIISHSVCSCKCTKSTPW